MDKKMSSDSLNYMPLTFTLHILFCSSIWVWQDSCAWEGQPIHHCILGPSCCPQRNPRQLHCTAGQWCCHSHTPWCFAVQSVPIATIFNVHFLCDGVHFSRLCGESGDTVHHTGRWWDTCILLYWILYYIMLGGTQEHFVVVKQFHLIPIHHCACRCTRHVYVQDSF